MVTTMMITMTAITMMTKAVASGHDNDNDDNDGRR